MKRSDALNRLVRDMRTDVEAYAGLQTLLDEQFASALRHDATALRRQADEITALVVSLDARRAVRARLVTALGGSGRGMDVVFDSLRPDSAERCRAMWRDLEQRVRACKALNVRNRLMMTDQYDIMQRVLHGEDTTYAPA